ncbi:MAG: tetratricopeptide repeat protein [Candidatus Cloacimonadota bacterium]|nr:tetratricopeptide repeat protein [Candidatus Cloacimonadota bacterium]
MKKSYFFLLALLLFACTNFNAYFNTFYNAKKFFREAQDIPLRNGRPTSSAITKYNEVIKKCGVILTDYKDSKYADDALLLMGKAFFYKGRGYMQAIEKFQELIKFYPQSEFVPEAHLYIARCNYNMNKKNESFSKLKNMLKVQDFEVIHPEVLLTLAEYYNNEDNEIQTEYYLKRIVDNFPKSVQFEKAYFKLGELYWDNEKYNLSLQTFQDLINSKVSNRTKLDARYYIALNNLELKNYDVALKESEKLLSDETDNSKQAKIELVKARSLANLHQTEEAEQLFLRIIEENKRSEVAAQAYFYLGEIYFDILHDYETAINYYNKVESQNRNSEFVEKAVSKSSVASQIIQYYQPDSSLDIETLVEQQFKLAEFYLQNLEQPDSALVVYDDIINHNRSVQIEIDSLQTKQDSLKNFIEDLKKDIVTESAEVTVLLDSSELKNIEDSLSTLPDSLFYITTEDTLAFAPDSIAISKTDSLNIKNVKSDSLQIQLEELEQKIERKKQELDIYNEICIPQASFLKIWIFDKIKQDSTKADSILTFLQTNYPKNKYTKLSQKLLKNENLELEENPELQEYERAIQYLEDEPQKTVELLEPIAQDSTHSHHHQALFSLGYIHYFELGDSTAARPYWEQILATENNIWQQHVSNYYDGEKFIRLQRLPLLQQYLEKAAADTVSTKQDSLSKAKSEAEKTFIGPQMNKPDSLYIPQKNSSEDE